MKLLRNSAILFLAILILTGCNGKSPGKNKASKVEDTIQVPDTGYTGIKQYFSGNRMVKEVSFKNGIRQGETRTFYKGGQLYQTFWYENGLREDSARWYYTSGQLFRSTPYNKDTINGIQQQYYKNGRLKARIGYVKGLRTPFLEEYTHDGKKISDYPEILVSIDDHYKSAGKIKITLELSNKSHRVVFYRGEFENGVFDTSKYAIIKSFDGKGTLEMKKTGSAQSDKLELIAETITDFGNKYLTHKEIRLPYADLR